MFNFVTVTVYRKKTHQNFDFVPRTDLCVYKTKVSILELTLMVRQPNLIKPGASAVDCLKIFSDVFFFVDLIIYHYTELIFTIR